MRPALLDLQHRVVQMKIVNSLHLTFIGQDGADFAGRLCTGGATNDNVHLRLEGMQANVKVVSYRVDEPAGGGVWAAPCDPISNWQLHVIPARDGQVDFYFKPFRDAPAGIAYIVTVQYDDGQVQRASAIGTRVKP